MSVFTTEAGNPKNITATGAITVAACQLIGFTVNSTSSGTLVFRDGGASGTVLNGAITPAAGTFVRFPAIIGTSLYVTVGGTIDITVFYAS